MVLALRRGDQELRNGGPQHAPVRVLVTGGLGYLGDRLAEILQATLRCELSLATRSTLLSDTAPRGARIVPIDWNSDAALAAACQGMQAVVHLAGMNAAECERDPVAALEFNGVATARLVRAAAAQGVRRFVYLSTAHVYGAALKGTVDELTCPQPRHPYATSHRAGEDAVQAAGAAQALDSIVVRLSNAFGAPVNAETNCWSLVTNDLTRQAVTTHRAVLRSAGNQRRDFVPVSEACRAVVHLLSLPRESVGEGLFNVGGAWAPTILDMAELISERVAACLGFRPQVVAGNARDAAGAELVEYSVSRLAATGFTVRRDAVAEELDRLVAFCARQLSAAT